jgi:hypothetical protein
MKRRITFGSFTMFAGALLLFIASAPYAKDYVETRRCGKQLAIIDQAARVWADAHNGRLPSGFILLSNELVNPRLLLCPGDKSREPADNWQALTSVYCSYQIGEAALGAKDLPPEVLQHIYYLGCKVHSGNYVNALGKVSVRSCPIPIRVRFLAGLAIVGLAIVVFRDRCFWHRYRPVQGQHPAGSVAGDLLPRMEQVRHDYLAARGMAPSPWHRKGLVAAARHAVRALAFFRDRKSDPQARENPRTT